jgi:hypothetical protein
MREFSIPILGIFNRIESNHQLTTERHDKIRHGSIPGDVAAVRQNEGNLAMIGETRVLANCGYGTPIRQT